MIHEPKNAIRLSGLMPKGRISGSVNVSFQLYNKRAAGAVMLHGGGSSRQGTKAHPVLGSDRILNRTACCANGQ